MGVDEVDGAELLHGEEVKGEGVDGGLKFGFGIAGDFGRGNVAADFEIGAVFVLFSPAVNLDFDRAICRGASGEFAGEVFDVDAGSAVDVGRVLPCD